MKCVVMPAARWLYRALSVGLSCLVAAACASPTNLAGRAADYNEAVEQSTNIGVLMNAVRASKRLPMVYTRLGSITYRGSLEASPNAEVTFGNDTNEDIPVGIKFGARDERNVNFESLAGQEFYNAILAGVDFDQVRFYREQGWPDELLFSLFIERIEFGRKTWDEAIMPGLVPDGGTLSGVEQMLRDADAIRLKPGAVVVENDPTEPAAYLLFRFVVDQVASHYEIELSQSRTTPPPEYCDGNAERAPPGEPPLDDRFCERLSGYRQAFTLDQARDVDLSFVNDRYRIERGVVFQRLSRGTSVEFRLLDENNQRVPESTTGAGTCRTTFTAAGEDAAALTANGNGEATSGRARCPISVVFRSPNAIVYYLGELLRAQSDPVLQADYYALCTARELGYRSYPPVGWWRSDERPGDFLIGYDAPCASRRAVTNGASDDAAMFFLESEPEGRARRLTSIGRGEGLYAFSFQGERFAVAEDAALRGRTMQAVTLVNELFYQRQKASSPPSVSILSGQAF